MSVSFPRFVFVSDCAVLVELGDVVDDAVNLLVIALDQSISDQPPKGLVEVVPAFVNLLAIFDPMETDHNEIQTCLESLLKTVRVRSENPKTHTVDVSYDGDYAQDLERVAQAKDMSPEAVITAHLAGKYRVSMYGFAPGYAYMSGVRPEIQVPRKSTAVRDIPAGAVMIAGPQCLITTIVMPTGWSIIGRSSTQVLTNDPKKPFLFSVGDNVVFKRVTRAQMEKTLGGGSNA